MQKSRPVGDTVFSGICDNRKAKEVLGWQPRIDLRKRLSIMYRYMRLSSPVAGAQT